MLFRSDGTAVTDEKLWSLMAPWIAPHEAEIWRSASYRFHALVADDWQEGRVFLAGDSAHQTPPFLGQGMCQGLRDAGNLAWKLHLVITGQASDSLLRTYTKERRPNVVETTRLAKEFGKIISERDPVKARARDEKIFADNNGQARTVVRQNLIPPLQAGFIAAQTPLAGKVFPQPMLEIFGREPMWMDDLTGPRFRLVVCAEQLAQADLQSLVEAAGTVGVQVTVLTDQEGFRPLWPSHVSVGSEKGALVKNELNQAGVMAALVRPDHYVYAGLNDVASALACLKDLGAQLDLQTG